MAKRTGFQWDVQPYRFLEDLRAHYTETVMLATQARSQTIAEQATAWMKQHAPWQDITKEARKGVRAYVMRFQEDSAAEASGLIEAQKADEMLLDELQTAARERREAARERARALRAGTRGVIRGGEVVEVDGKKVIQGGTIIEPYRPPDLKAADRLLQKTYKQKQYRRPQRVPKGRSAVAKYKAGAAGRRSPLVEVKFTHNTDLPYVIWLEIANQGRYAIISRAISHWRPILFGEIKKIATLKQYRDKIRLPVYQTDAQRFQDFVREEEFDKGRPYEPWSPAVQQRRRKRASKRNAETEKQYRADLKARQEKASTRITKTIRQEEVATFGIPTVNRRRSY